MEIFNDIIETLKKMPTWLKALIVLDILNNNNNDNEE